MHGTNIKLAPTCFGVAGAPSSVSPMDPDQIVHMLRHKCRINEGRDLGTYDVAHAQFVLPLQFLLQCVLCKFATSTNILLNFQFIKFQNY
jgi:hypothetical protein